MASLGTLQQRPAPAPSLPSSPKTAVPKPGFPANTNAPPSTVTHFKWGKWLLRRYFTVFGAMVYPDQLGDGSMNLSLIPGTIWYSPDDVNSAFGPLQYDAQLGAYAPQQVLDTAPGFGAIRPLAPVASDDLFLTGSAVYAVPKPTVAHLPDFYANGFPGNWPATILDTLGGASHQTVPVTPYTQPLMPSSIDYPDPYQYSKAMQNYQTAFNDWLAYSNQSAVVLPPPVKIKAPLPDIAPALGSPIAPYFKVRTRPDPQPQPVAKPYPVLPPVQSTDPDDNFVLMVDANERPIITTQDNYAPQDRRYPKNVPRRKMKDRKNSDPLYGFALRLVNRSWGPISETLDFALVAYHSIYMDVVDRRMIPTHGDFTTVQLPDGSKAFRIYAGSFSQAFKFAVQNDRGIRFHPDTFIKLLAIEVASDKIFGQLSKRLMRPSNRPVGLQAGPAL